LWLTVTLVVLLIVAVALWLQGAFPDGDRSPLPTPTISAASPLPTPTDVVPTSDTSPLPPSWVSGGAALLWVALGIVLSLGVAFIITRWHRSAD